MRAWRTAPWVVVVLALLVGAWSMPGAAAHEVSCANPDVPGGEWRRFGNQLTGDRTQPREHLLTPGQVATLEPVWTFDANRATFMQHNEITGYPVVADGCVYVGSSSGWQQPGWVFALNADTGELVWRTRLDRGVYSTVAVEHGLVYAFVSKVKAQGDTQIGGPYVIALDQRTGREVWRTTVDHQIGSDAVSSPIVYDGIVWVGVSGTAAEVDETDRGLWQGSSVFLDAITGEILAKTYSIPEQRWEEGYAGAAQWATIAIDPDTSFGYVGTGNPFDFDEEHEHTNAVLKLDMARARDLDGNPVPSTAITNPDFGRIAGAYKGEVEAYDPEFAEVVDCDEVESLSVLFLFGFECANLDLDFGAQANIFTDATGRKLVGIGQKSGVYHTFDADTMQPVWTSVLGVPSPVGGIVGSAAHDGQNLYGPHTIGGYLWSVEKQQGGLRWLAPVADGVHWAPPVVHGNGILYTVDLKGFLDAYDAATGTPLLHRPMNLGADTGTAPTFSWGGVTVARNTVYASVGVGLASLEQPLLTMPNGFVIAFRPAGLTP